MAKAADLLREFKELFGERGGDNTLRNVPRNVEEGHRVVPLCKDLLATRSARLQGYFRRWDERKHQVGTPEGPREIDVNLHLEEQRLVGTGMWEAAWALAQLHYAQWLGQEAASGRRELGKGHPLCNLALVGQAVRSPTLERHYGLLSSAGDVYKAAPGTRAHTASAPRSPSGTSPMGSTMSGAGKSPHGSPASAHTSPSTWRRHWPDAGSRRTQPHGWISWQGSVPARRGPSSRCCCDVPQRVRPPRPSGERALRPRLASSSRQRLGSGCMRRAAPRTNKSILWCATNPSTWGQSGLTRAPGSWSASHLLSRSQAGNSGTSPRSACSTARSSVSSSLARASPVARSSTNPRPPNSSGADSRSTDSSYW